MCRAELRDLSRNRPLRDDVLWPQWTQMYQLLILDVADLSSLIQGLERPFRPEPAYSLLLELLKALNPDATSIRAHLVFSSRAAPAPYTVPHRAREIVSVVWLPSRSFARSPLSGLLAHEAAHSVELLPHDGPQVGLPAGQTTETLADSFGAALLGPGFAWAVSAYLGQLKSDRQPAGEYSANHPSWPIRVACLKGIAGELWESALIKDWYLSHIEAASKSAGQLSSDNQSRSLELRQAVKHNIGRLRKVSVDERGLIDIRQGKRDKRARYSQVLAFNLDCPY